MGNLYIDTGGNALNSGSSDNNAPDLSGVLASAAGAVITLDAGTVLTGVVIAGATQSTINIQGATNANRTIFGIIATAGSGGATPTVTVDASVTGVLTTWRIGGRYLWPGTNGVNVMEGFLGLGESSAPDIVTVNNSPATKTVTYLTSRVAGNGAKGAVVIRNKTGVRPVFNVTNTAQGFTIGHAYWRVEGIEGQQNGASGNFFGGASGVNAVYVNDKVSDAGALGFQLANSCTVLMSEVSGCGTSGISGVGVASVGMSLLGNYIHDNATDGFASTLTTITTITFVVGNIIDTNAGRGIFLSGAIASLGGQVMIVNNTIYGNLNSGVEISDQDHQVFGVNNILKDNGNTGTEYNWNQVAWPLENIGWHDYNCFNISGGAGGSNLFQVTVQANEITTDPLFTNAAGADFSLGSTSPCKGTGFPGQFLGSNLGYMDMGAVQRQESGGAAGLQYRNLMQGNIG